MQTIIPCGVIISAPGVAGSPSVFQFGDSGDPNNRLDPLGLLAGCAIGSTFSRTDAPDSVHAFYVKTSGPTSASPNGVWTPK